MSSLTLKNCNKFYINSDCKATVTLYRRNSDPHQFEAAGVGTRSVWLPSGFYCNDLEVQLDFKGTVYEYAIMYEESIN